MAALGFRDRAGVQADRDAIVAVCRLAQCYPTHALAEHLLHEQHARPWDATGWCHWTEYSMGDFGPGRCGWILADMRALPEPIPWKGGQRLFEIPDNILTESVRKEQP